jgi:hypothetical protein
MVKAINKYNGKIGVIYRTLLAVQGKTPLQSIAA